MNKEKLVLVGCLVLSALTCLWVVQKPESNGTAKEDVEMGVSIPSGFLVVPLELSNGAALSLMIKKMAVIDVFNSASLKLAENLRVLKLNNEENPSFGALVPDKEAGTLQNIFSAKNLKGALKKSSQAPTQFFHLLSKKQSIDIFNVQE